MSTILLLVMKKTYYTFKFPSPCGEDVMSTAADKNKASYIVKFPSPCGEDVMST